MNNVVLINRISLDSSICGGRPCIKGSRIEVTIILDALVEGLRPEEIIDHYPTLTLLDIRAAIAYASELARENIWKVSVL